jgi:isopenicillin N synthase-like dioxygenase
MSNDKYNSAEHRVILNTQDEARVSIAVFFTSGQRRDSVLYGPLPELVSSEDPPKYRNFTMSEFLGTFFGRDLGSKALTDHFRL